MAPSSSSSPAAGSGRAATAQQAAARARAATAASESGLNDAFKKLCAVALERGLEGPAALEWAAGALRREGLAGGGEEEEEKR